MEIILQSKSCAEEKEQSSPKCSREHRFACKRNCTKTERDTEQLSAVTASWSKLPSSFFDPPSAISDLTTPFSLPSPKLTVNVHSSFANICVQKESTKFLTEAFSRSSRRTHWLQPPFSPSHQGNPSNTNTASQQTKIHTGNCVEASLLENKHFSHKQS